MPLSFGDMNDILTLGITASGIAGTWWLWGRKWYVKRKQEREAIVFAAMSVPKMVEEQEKQSRSLESLQGRDAGITAQFAALHGRLDTQDASLDEIKLRIAGAWDSDPVAQFVCDNDGKNVDVNQAYADLVGVDKRRLTGWGFKNFVVDADDGYIEEWLSCVRDHRIFEREAKMRNAAGAQFSALVRAWPQPEQPPARAWHGYITVTEAAK